LGFEGEGGMEQNGGEGEVDVGGRMKPRIPGEEEKVYGKQIA